MSAVRRCSKPVPNQTRFVINRNEDHYESHYLPWLEAAHTGGNQDRIESVVYEGGELHGPPSPKVFREQLNETLEYAETLPPATLTSHE